MYTANCEHVATTLKQQLLNPDGIELYGTLSSLEQLIRESRTGTGAGISAAGGPAPSGCVDADCAMSIQATAMGIRRLWLAVSAYLKAFESRSIEERNSAAAVMITETRLALEASAAVAEAETEDSPMARPRPCKHGRNVATAPRIQPPLRAFKSPAPAQVDSPIGPDQNPARIVAQKNTLR